MHVVNLLEQAKPSRPDKPDRVTRHFQAKERTAKSSCVFKRNETEQLRLHDRYP
jgi:hypothetical protein